MAGGRRVDLAVLGGGTAGLVAALGAAGLGARVVLIEDTVTGGECLWTGCVPSKSLLAAADLAHRMRHAGDVGLSPVRPTVELGAVMEHVNGARRRLAEHDDPVRLQRHGVDVIHGRGRFTGPGELHVTGPDRVVRWRRALVATGSTPVVPDVPGLADADPLTNDTVWDLASLPERLLVVGGGPVGCELGQAFARLGSQVTLAEMAPGLLPGEDPEAGERLAERLAAEGVDVRVGTRLSAVRPEGAGHRATLLSEQGQEWLGVDRILVAAGRRPRSDGLGLPGLGVTLDDGGAVVTDERQRTSARGVFAAGDVTGGPAFTHLAAHQAGVVVGNALFGLRRRASTTIPRVAYTDPEVAGVGLSATEARHRWGRKATVATYDYAGLDRAVCAGDPVGLAKLVADPRGRLVGATVISRRAGETIAEMVAWMSAGAKLSDVFGAVHPYPSFAEGPVRAAGDHLRRRWLRPRTRGVTRPVLALARLVDRPR